MADKVRENTMIPGADTIGAPQATVPKADSAPTASNAILENARKVCIEVLGPHAQEADRAAGPRVENFEALASYGLLGIAIPKEFGGLDAPAVVQRQYTEILASYCGVTTFVQAQHHGASRMIAGSKDALLRNTLVPNLAAGRALCAISFAHLRRPGPPILRALFADGGVRLSGTAPWVTGWGLMNQVVLGATLPDGSFIYVWSPANRNDYPELFEQGGPSSDDWGSMTATNPLPLCTMNASATVAIHLDNWFIPQSHVLSQSDRTAMHRNDRNGVLNATAMPIGCASAGVRILEHVAATKKLPAIARAAKSFADEVNEARNQVEFWTNPDGAADPGFFERAVEIRAWCIELALRTAHAAITAVSGSANSLDHPAQRLIRESMFYTVQAQTVEVMDATLARLERQV